MASTSPQTQPAPFGTVFAEHMVLVRYRNGAWDEPDLVPSDALTLHPAAHVLHYGSACFEGLKAFRTEQAGVQIFRLDRHVARMAQSARLVCLPEPPEDLLRSMILTLVSENRDLAPEFPGSLYLRPTLIGTQPNVGAAATPSTEAMLFVLGCPVGDYFAGGARPLRISVEETGMRSTPGFGVAKTGANYVQALRHVEKARAHGVDQVLFAPGGDVQETGASNFMLLRNDEVLTKPLDGSFLAGVTRESILELARALGYRVSERDFTVEEMLDWVKTGEAALSGTAAVMSPVGTLVCRGDEHRVGDGGFGPNTRRLRDALMDIQCGRAQTGFDWLTPVGE